MNKILRGISRRILQANRFSQIAVLVFGALLLVSGSLLAQEPGSTMDEGSAAAVPENESREAEDSGAQADLALIDGTWQKMQKKAGMASAVIFSSSDNSCTVLYQGRRYVHTITDVAIDQEVGVTRFTLSLERNNKVYTVTVLAFNESKIYLGGQIGVCKIWGAYKKDALTSEGDSEDDSEGDLEDDSEDSSDDSSYN